MWVEFKQMRHFEAAEKYLKLNMRIDDPVKHSFDFSRILTYSNVNAM